MVLEFGESLPVHRDTIITYREATIKSSQSIGFHDLPEAVQRPGKLPIASTLDQICGKPIPGEIQRVDY